MIPAAPARIVGIFLSRKFAVNLLIAMVAVLVVSSLLPDIASLTPAEVEALRTARPLLYRTASVLRPQELTSSPYFLLLPVLIFLSTTICTLRRLSSRRRIEGGFFVETSGPAGMSGEEIAALLAAEKWSVARENDSVTADKGRFGFWGSMLFHLGLLAVFVAVVVTSLTQFSAELVLTEGFPLRLGKDAFARIHRDRGLASLPDPVIELKKFIPTYERDIYQKDFSAVVSIDGEDRDVHVNRPAALGGFQLSLHRFGFAPSFRITDRQGRELLNATVNLIVLNGAEDSFAVPGSTCAVSARLFPDFYRKDGGPGTRSNVPRNPVLLLRLQNRGEETGGGLLPLGATATVGGLRITFDGLGYWADFIVSRDYGLWLFAAGTGLGILGLMVRFAMPDKQLVITVAGTGLSIKGRCTYYPVLFEHEMKRLFERMQHKRVE